MKLITHKLRTLWRASFGSRSLSYLGLLLLLAAYAPFKAHAVDDQSYISHDKQPGAFPLSVAGKSVPLFISEDDFPGVIRALGDLKADIGRVTDVEPQVTVGKKVPKAKEIVLVGTLGKSPIIDQLVKNKKLDVSGITGKWETHLIQVVEKPMKGVDRALVIVGSDKRGSIFGIYDLSQQIGVSPWYWWADVPVQHQENLYVLAGKHTKGTPKVKYRGIFINDEAPALTGWAFEKFGGFNHHFYENVFELILRMKGNFLWPAMWGREFYVEDTLNPILADEYGVVIGTSHHEPMMRAHAEWRRYGEGPWNYRGNEATLKEYWKGGFERMGENESLVTIGMRGDGDEPMSEGTEISLLEKIVEDQRNIIEEVSGKPAAATPQVWALYKEVQDYYDSGMRVPDDVTLLLCDDNWGNVRKLPALGDTLRKGGYGMYYHFDYVGGPRNYKWINTNPIDRVWEQMHLTYEYGVKEIWVVNVGDIKPMELPTEFFLDFAWNPDQWPAERLPEYTKLWVASKFGQEHAAEIAEILTLYTKYNGRRKPELLSPETYSLVHFREAERVVEDYNALADKAERLYKVLPEKYKDAYYQLVLFPVQASANLNELHITTGRNRLYAQQGRASTNDLADKVQALFDRDAELTKYFHTALADGKWNHMMSQTHISYTYWQQPEKDVVPEVERIDLAKSAAMGVAIEGSKSWWPNEKAEAVLPELSPFQSEGRYIDIYNRSEVPFDYQVSSTASWLEIGPATGNIEKEQRIWIKADWANAPTGVHKAPITIAGPDKQTVVVQVVVHNPVSSKPSAVAGFVESDGYVAMEAAHYTNKVEKGDIQWLVIPDLGKTLSGVTLIPVTSPAQTPKGNSPRLEYKIHLFSEGEVKVKVYVSPTLNFHNKGLRYAISIDDEAPQIINIHEDLSEKAWEKSVADNIKILESKHNITTPGEHVLKFWMVDPAVVLQKIVVETGESKPSYLGPPESFLHK